jgi:hypothetical protein
MLKPWLCAAKRIVSPVTLWVTDANPERLLRSACRQLLYVNEISARKSPTDKLAYLRVKFGIQHR